MDDGTDGVSVVKMFPGEPEDERALGLGSEVEKRTERPKQTVNEFGGFVHGVVEVWTTPIRWLRIRGLRRHSPPST